MIIQPIFFRCFHLILVFLFFLFAACTATKRVTSINNTFLEDVDIKKKIPNLPFEHSWVWNDFPPGSFDAIYFKPVDLKHLPKDSWVRSESLWIETEEEYNDHAHRVAKQLHHSLVFETQFALNGKYRIVDAPGPRVLIVETALTELEFSHPLARTASLIAPIPGTGAAIASITDPHVAFAMRFIDSDSGKLFATIGDRRFPPTRIIDLNKLSVSSSVNEVCNLWAENIAEVFAKGRFAKVEKTKRFSLIPW